MNLTIFHTPRDMSPEESWNPPTELEEMDAACKAIGRKLENIVVSDDRNGFALAPLDSRYMATFGEYDLDCVQGTGATPESAIWNLIDQTS